MRRRIPRSRGAISGVLIVILGLWAGLVPFIGPYFHYSMHSTQHWHWFADRAWLEVLPAGVAVIGGLMLIRSTTRASASLGAMLALAAGLWLVIGPIVSTLWHHGAIVVGPPMGAHTITRVLEWLGYFYGAGALIVLFSAYALGFIAALPLVDERVVGTGGTATGRRRWRAPAADPVPAGAPAADDETRVTTSA
jgi:hypothetical protein